MNRVDAIADRMGVGAEVEQAPVSLYVRTSKPKAVNPKMLSARELFALVCQWNRYSAMYRSSRLSHEDFQAYLAVTREALDRLEKGSK